MMTFDLAIDPVVFPLRLSADGGQAILVGKDEEGARVFVVRRLWRYTGRPGMVPHDVAYWTAIVETPSRRSTKCVGSGRRFSVDAFLGDDGPRAECVRFATRFLTDGTERADQIRGYDGPPTLECP